MGTLTRAEMEDVIRGGGSILWQGQIVAHIGQLPSEADLAAGDPALEAAARAALDAQILALTQAKARLDLAKQVAIAPLPVVTESEPESEPAPHAAKRAR